MTDNTDTLDTLYDKYQLESESESVDWFKLKQALNLYIEEKVSYARRHGYNSGWTAHDRNKLKKVVCPICKTIAQEVTPELITDEDIKKGWPKV